MIRVPRLNLLSSPEVRQPGKAPNYSVNWTTSLSDFENQNTKDLKEDNQLEIVDAMKGKEQVEKILKWKSYCLTRSSYLAASAYTTMC